MKFLKGLEQTNGAVISVLFGCIALIMQITDTSVAEQIPVNKTCTVSHTCLCSMSGVGGQDVSTRVCLRSVTFVHTSVQ
jgi:hypothetical protein